MEKYLYNVSLNGKSVLMEQTGEDEPHATKAVAEKMREHLTDRHTADHPIVITAYRGSFTGNPISVRVLYRFNGDTFCHPKD